MHPFNLAKYGAVDKDVIYSTADGQELRMDLYYPAYGESWPVLIFVHGGGWTEGDKAPLPVVPTFAGYLVASINYRMYPAYRFPAMIEDVKCAIRYLRAHAVAYNLDPDRIALIGHSAGGHLAALAGLAQEGAGWDVGEHLDHPSQVQAVVAMSGPTDLTRQFPDWVMELKTDVFGEAQWAIASPVNYAHAKAPPFLIIHGDADAEVPVAQAHQLYDALLEAGAPVEKLILHNGGHGLEPVDGAMTPSAEEMFAVVFSFLARCLGDGWQAASHPSP
jgi:acetyl esterase/lipase